MDYEKKYKEAIERAKTIDKHEYRDIISTICPELKESKESEDERIRKAIGYAIGQSTHSDGTLINEVSSEEALAWLEKQSDKDKLIKELGKYKVKYTQEVLEKHINSTSNKDDERLRKTTIAFLKDFAEQGYENAVECIDWLEKQGESDETKAKMFLINKGYPIDANGIFPTYEEMYDIIKEGLEKQGEQNNNEDETILYRFSFYSYKDEPNILYLAGLYVNDKYHNKGIGTKILEVTDEVAKSLNCHGIRLKTKKGSNAERLYQTHGYNSLASEARDEIWLEKQDKQKPADEVKSKFHKGDWITFCGGNPFKILKVERGRNGILDYLLLDQNGCDSYYNKKYVDENARLWDITKDTKDGDVLQHIDDNRCCIFKKISLDENYFHAYCGIDNLGEFISNAKNDFWGLSNKYVPANKEQRDVLGKVMVDAGWEFDFKKKKLKKIEQKPAWSEEDETGLSDALWAIRQAKTIAKDENDMGNLWYAENWLKLLKNRVQLQPQWKPSEEQMKCLNKYAEQNNYDGTILTSLYNDLKRLCV